MKGPDSFFCGGRGICLATLLLFTSCATHRPVTFTTPQPDLENNTRREQEFLAFDPHYKEEKAQRVAKMRLLYKQVQDREAAGQKTACSKQILWELKARVMQTADFKAMDQRLADLEASLAHPELEGDALEQSPEDGSWGRCYVPWWCKLDASTDELGKEANKKSLLKFPTRFLDAVNSPEKLENYLMSVSVSDIARTGVDNLGEFNLSTSNLMRLILRDRPKGYPWDPQLKVVIMNLVLNKFRNPATGYWGERYVRDGRLQFVDDLSMTFHIVTYLHGNVSDLRTAVATTLAVKDLDFPVGWLFKGQYWNHNNMDVVAIFKAGWPQATPAQQKAMAVEIEKMLQWCLTESLQPDGSFKPHIGDGSLEEGLGYGTSFLARIGYFDKSERFWTDREFPEAEGVRQKIIAYVRKHRDSGGSGGAYYESVLAEDLHYDANAGAGSK